MANPLSTRMVLFRYCSKEHDFREWGLVPEEENDRNQDIISTALTEGLSGCLKRNPKITLRHWFALKSIVEHEQRYSFMGVDENTTLLPWQEACLATLYNQDDRKMLFVIDELGGSGKSFLTKYLMQMRQAWGCNGGKTSDLMCAYKPGAEIAVFDMARSNASDWWPWGFMENLKNGWFCSTKYNSTIKTFPSPKIIIFTNQFPPLNRFSIDRYQFLVLTKVADIWSWQIKSNVS